MRVIVFAFLFSCTLVAGAGDWPQGLGPHRTGVALEEVTVKAWPNSGPEKQWSHELGMGYAGPVVSGDHVVT